MLNKKIWIYLLTLVLTYVAAYFLSDQLFYTSFQGLNLGIDFNAMTFIGSLLAIFLLRRSSYIDLVFSIPLIVLSFMALNLSTFIIFAIGFLSIVKLHNLKFLLFISLNLIAMLIFKSDTNSLVITLVIASLLFIALSKDSSVFLTLFLLKYFTLIDYGQTITSISTVIIPLCVMLLIWLYVKNNVKNAICLLSLMLVLLTPVITASVMFTSLALIALSELMGNYRNRCQLVLTGNIALVTIVLSLTYLTDQAQLIPLVVLLITYVEFNHKGQELNYAK